MDTYASQFLHELCGNIVEEGDKKLLRLQILGSHFTKTILIRNGGLNKIGTMMISMDMLTGKGENLGVHR